MSFGFGLGFPRHSLLGGGYSPAQLFAGGEPGVWYDPSDLNTLFQDSAGTTPVTAVEQAVGLMLDKSRGLALGSELYANQVGTFDNSTGGATATYTSATQTVSVTVAGTNNGYPRLLIDLGLVTNRTYYVIGRIDGTRAGITQIRLATSGPANNVGYNSTTGVFEGRVVAAASSIQFLFQGQITGSRNIATLSVREIAGTHRIQPNAASRAVLRNRYNLLTYSEQFDNAVWTKTNTTVADNAAVAPDGTTTADTIIEGSGAQAQFSLQRSLTVVAGTTFALSICIKRAVGTLRGVRLEIGGGTSGFRANFDPDTGAVNSTDVYGTGSVVDAGSIDLGNSWRRYFVTGVAGAETSVAIYASRFLSTPTGATIGYTGDGTQAFYIWGADLRAANDTVYPYQRIAAATDYDSDTSKFPLYLEYDGSDDSYYTAANLDLSGTDKVTVFAGVSKLSDAAQAAVVELSATIASNNGTFLLAAPDAASATIGWDSKGTTQVDAVASSSVAAPLTAVLTGIGDIGGDSAILRVNGAVADSETGDQGTGNYGSYALNIGARSSASSPSLRFRGREYQLIVRGAQSSTPDINSTERFIANQKMLRPL